MRPFFDIQLLISTAVIILIGVLVHFSISPNSINLHILYLCLGLGLSWILSKIDYQVIRSFSWHIYFMTIGLLILTLLIASVTRGSRRWIDLGLFQFQSSELAKLALILLVPDWLKKFPADSFINILKLGGLIGVPAGLVFIQPDLGSSLIIFGISVAMIFVGGLPIRYIVISILLAIVLSPLAWMTLKDYQKDRIHTFLDPASDPLGKGYNSIQSQIAVGSGKFFGRGLGHGTQSKLQFLPEYKTDFVFASLAEELGFMGCALLLSAFLWLVIRLATLASNSDSQYSSIAITGITVMFLIQIVINIGMNIGILPVTGITLPFVSAGGTSLVISLAAMGVVVGLAKKTNLTSGIEITGKDK